MPNIKAIKRHSKCRRIHIYSKIIYNHFLRSSHKKRHRVIRCLRFSVRSRHTIGGLKPLSGKEVRPMRVRNVPPVLKLPQTAPSHRGGGTSPSLFGATASSGMAGQPPYPETRAEPNNSAAGAENPEIRRIFVRIVPASRTVVADPPCAEPAGGGVPGRRKENTNANDIWQTKKSSFRWSA